METPRIKELLNPDSFVDKEGDIHPRDDAGFDAVGYRRFSDLYREDVAPDTLDDKDHFYQSIADAEVILPLRLERSYPSVELGRYATNMAQALTKFARMNELNGLVKSGDKLKIHRYGGEARLKRDANQAGLEGNIYFALGYGETALTNAGVDPLVVHDDMMAARYQFKEAYLGSKN